MSHLLRIPTYGDPNKRSTIRCCQNTVDTQKFTCVDYYILGVTYLKRHYVKLRPETDLNPEATCSLSP